MQNMFKTTTLLLVALTLTSNIVKSQVEIVFTDPVCGKKVNSSESFDWSYAGKKYYFDTYDCRAAFKMNPQEFLLHKCVPDETIDDPVCGMKVNKAESYDLKYEGVKYYFDSYECRETFKMNPKKFIENKCAPKNSIKTTQ